MISEGEIKCLYEKFENEDKTERWKE